MKTRSFSAFAGLIALLAIGLSGAAQAQQQVYWSVGLSSPGVQLGVGSAPPVLVLQPGYQPVYLQQRPVYVAAQPVYYVRPVPVMVAPPRYIRADWRYAGHRHGWEERRERQEHWTGQHTDHGEHDRRGTTADFHARF